MIPSGESSLYAVKRILGWCVAGSLSCTSKNRDKVSCNRVLVEEAGSQNSGKNQFCIINEVKDTGIRDVLNNGDFTESVQPRKFVRC